MAENRTGITPRGEGARVERLEPLPASPFRELERMADEMDRLFDEALEGGPLALCPEPEGSPATRTGVWVPPIDVRYHDQELIIRADLPGLHVADISVEINDGAVMIRGERRREHEDERDDVFRSERSYGTFYRVVPLPAGAITDEAKASFRDGVLEITMPAPPQAAILGRRLPIATAPTPRP